MLNGKASPNPLNVPGTQENLSVNPQVTTATHRAGQTEIHHAGIAVCLLLHFGGVVGKLDPDVQLS